jgi:ABC-type branched-subunit amino acid transport system substrate-binding protein
MNSRSIAPALALALLAALGCSGTADTHVVSPQGAAPRPEVADPELSVERLESLLAAALLAEPSAEALRLADLLERRGRALTDLEFTALLGIADAVPASQLSELAGKTDAAAIVDLRLGLVLRHKGDVQGVQRILRRAAHAARLTPHLDALRASLEQAPVDATLIAVLLPMSGPYAAIGEELWAGMALALDEKSATRITVFDTLGTEEGARRAVQAARDAGALLALGPAGRNESRAAARAAAAVELPIALLAPEAEATDAEAGVFRLALSPSFEAEQAAIVAVELGYRLLAIMTPRDALGREQTRAFVRTARAIGAEVVAQGTYDPSSANLQEDFKKFLEIEATINPRYRKHMQTYGRTAWKSFTPTLPFDFLYMPDTVERGTLAASYLPFFNVEVRTRDEMSIDRLRLKHRGRMPRIVQLMGASGWLDPSLGARGGSAVEGALVIGTCPGGHGIDLSERGRSFNEAFLREQGRPPSAAAATANDAMTMVLLVRAWAAGHGGKRADAARAMRSAQLRDGVCGTQTVDAAGQVQGQIEVLRVEQGKLEIYEY